MYLDSKTYLFLHILQFYNGLIITASQESPLYHLQKGSIQCSEDKIHSRRDHEGPEEQKYMSILSLTSVLDGGG